jgi:lysine 2,3-aminomutase
LFHRSEPALLKAGRKRTLLKKSDLNPGGTTVVNRDKKTIRWRHIMRYDEKIENLDKMVISPKSHRIMRKLFHENPRLKDIFDTVDDDKNIRVKIREWMMEILQEKPDALAYYQGEASGRRTFEKLEWSDYAAIRILDYLDHSGERYADLNLRGIYSVTEPFRFLRQAYRHGTSGAEPAFFRDMLHLFRQLSGRRMRRLPDPDKVLKWMDRHPSGLDPEIVALREKNRDRILRIIIRKIDAGEMHSAKFYFKPGMTDEQKYQAAREWWNMKNFHLAFAVRDPDLLNEMLGNSLNSEIMDVLHDARDAGIPFFINPYYLSLLNVQVSGFAAAADQAIRQYILYSKELVTEFGHIVAWEMEDQVEKDKPNAAGWILPSDHLVHRRYPEVAILIPDTVGRACGGLCSSCQRMYDFQSGNLNFKLEKLRPLATWESNLEDVMTYFENDSQLRDILITGGDALMSSDSSLEKILDAVYRMALRKRNTNKKRKDGEKYAEIIRVRLGTRLPVYIPMRITPELVKILHEFKRKAVKAGIRQFVIQTHFESAMEVTPEVKKAVERLLSAGWMITNQHVLTAASSRRGHVAKLRKVLNDIGILTYYTFSVKGYMENISNFAPNARAVQEQVEEKTIGRIGPEYRKKIQRFPTQTVNMVANIDDLRKQAGVPFLATDRNVINLPGVGKSLTFRVIGITRYGRRILEFDHDHTRRHSPIIEKMGRVIIIESKSIDAYIEQMDEMGEEKTEYEMLYGYSIGETEPVQMVFEYPEYDFGVTDCMTNLIIS